MFDYDINYIYFQIYTALMIYLGLFRFYGISTIAGYLMPNPVSTYILDLYGS